MIEKRISEREVKQGAVVSDQQSPVLRQSDQELGGLKMVKEFAQTNDIETLPSDEELLEGIRTHRMDLETEFPKDTRNKKSD